MAVIFISLAFSQTPIYTAGSQMQGQSITWYSVILTISLY